MCFTLLLLTLLTNSTTINFYLIHPPCLKLDLCGREGQRGVSKDGGNSGKKFNKCQPGSSKLSHQIFIVFQVIDDGSLEMWGCGDSDSSHIGNFSKEIASTIHCPDDVVSFVAIVHHHNDR